MDTLIVLVILVVIVGAAALFVCKEKKKGRVCIGCPHAQCCALAKKGGCGANCESKEN